MGCVGTKADKRTRKSTSDLCEGFLEDYLLGEVLGSGSSGQVRRAVLKASGAEFAVKVQHVSSAQHNVSLRGVTREALIWQKVGQHPNIVELHKSYLGPISFMVMELCECSLLKRRPKRAKVSLKDMFRGMLLGVAHCHECRVVHHDVKPDNFLYGSDDQATVKLCDFGLAEPLPRRSLIKDMRVGTHPYMSPEMLKNEGHNEKTDVWSLGVSCYLIVFGHFPYGPSAGSADEMMEAIINGRPPLFRRVEWMEDGRVVEGKRTALPPLNIVQFVQALLTRDPRERPAAREALDSNLFVDELVEDSRAARSQAKAMHQAKLKASHFERPNPTEHRHLNELLRKLQPELRRSFTCPETESASLFLSQSQGGGQGTSSERRESSSTMHSLASATSSVYSSERSRTVLSRSSTAPALWVDGRNSFRNSLVEKDKDEPRNSLEKLAGQIAESNYLQEADSADSHCSVPLSRGSVRGSMDWGDCKRSSRIRMSL